MMVDIPLVSVVIPTYNRAAVLVRAVDSAFSLLDVTIEVIVVDDGSTDDTPAVLEALSRRYGPALRTIRQSNAGASTARNTGLDAARGVFVQFLDSDDTLDERKAALQISTIEAEPEATMVLCHGWLETEFGEERIGIDLGPDPQSFIEAMCGRTVHIMSTIAPLWRRDYLTNGRRWNPKISLGDDLEFHVRCLADANRVAFVAQSLFSVHHHTGDRLSDFSSDPERLASLLRTRFLICDALVARGLWTEGCRTQMASALRSIFALCLQRMDAESLSQFEAEAARICGPDWLGWQLRAMSTVRRLGGKQAAVGAMKLAQHMRILQARLSLPRWEVRRRKAAHAVRARLERTDPASRAGARALLSARPAARSALYVEMNVYHAETVPGYVSLLAEAGYEVTVLHRAEAEIPEALCRLGQDRQPAQMLGVTLGQMKALLTCDLPGRFDLVMLGSGTFAERDGYFGGVLDYLGSVPEGRSGHLIIEHSMENLKSRGDRLRSENLFGLRATQSGAFHLPMLAPVDFGPPSPAPLSQPVRMAVVGRLTSQMRDVEGLFAAVRSLIAEPGPAFEIVLIGDSGALDIPEDLRPVFRNMGRLPFHEMYAAIDSAHVLLPLLSSQILEHRRYIKGMTTGTRQLSLGFHVPMVIDEVFARAYGIDDRTGLIHPVGDLVAGLQQAREITSERLTSLRVELGNMQRSAVSDSLNNLKFFVDRQTKIAG